MYKVFIYILTVCFLLHSCSPPKAVIAKVENHFVLLSNSEYQKAFDNLLLRDNPTLDQYVTYHENRAIPEKTKKIKLVKKEYKLLSIESNGEEYVVHYSLILNSELYIEAIYNNLRVRLLDNQWKIQENLENYLKIDSLKEIVLKERRLDSPYEAERTIAKILSIDSFHKEAKELNQYQQEKILDFIDAQEQMDSYLDSIVFEYDQSALYDFERLGKKEVITLSLLNLGTKTINDMKLLFKFYDADGNFLNSLSKTLIDSVNSRHYKDAFIDPNEKQSFMFQYFYLVEELGLIEDFDPSKTIVEIQQMSFM